MTSTILALAAALLIATFVGVCVLILLRVRLNVWEIAGFAPGIGGGLITILLFFAMRSGRPLTDVWVQVVLACALLPLAGGAMWSLRRVGPAGWVDRVSSSSRESTTDRRLLPRWTGPACAVAILLLIGYTLLMAVYWPPYAWDALTVWVLKGRVIRHTGLLTSIGNTAGLFYPLNLPLQVALLLPNVPLGYIQVIFPLYFVLLLLAFAGTVRRGMCQAQSLLFVALLAATPTALAQSSVAMADMPFAYHYSLSVFALLTFFRSRHAGFAALAGLEAGVATWTRPDGLMYFLINLAVLVLYVAWHRTGAVGLLSFVALFVPFWWPWTRYVAEQAWGGHFLPTAEASIRALAAGDVRVSTLWVVSKYFGTQLISFDVWGATWVVFCLSLVHLRALRHQAWLVVLVGLNITGLLFTYYSYDRPDALGWALDTGFVRMATHFMPLLWLHAALSFAFLERQFIAGPPRCVTNLQRSSV